MTHAFIPVCCDTWSGPGRPGLTSVLLNNSALLAGICNTAQGVCVSVCVVETCSLFFIKGTPPPLKCVMKKGRCVFCETLRFLVVVVVS